MTDVNSEPGSHLAILLVLLTPAPAVGRRIRAFDIDQVSVQFLRNALPDLSQPETVAEITAGQLTALARLALEGTDDEHSELLAPLRAILAARWTELSSDMVRIGLLGSYTSHRLFEALPELAGSDVVYDVLQDLDDNSAYVIHYALDVEQLPAPRPDQLRAVLPKMTGRRLPGLASAALLAAAGPHGWSHWLTVSAVLWRFPDLADPGASETPPDDRHESDKLHSVHEKVWRTAYADTSGRALARLLLDLRDELSQSPADYREVYLDQLQAVVGDDVGLRRSALEGLAWLGKDRARGIAVYAATHLFHPEDRAFLRSLEHHPDRQVQLTAGLIGRIVDDAPTPRARVASAPAVAAPAPRGEGARTWLGDRRLERVIEDTVSSLEATLADQYANTHRSGEDRLGERFFAILGERFTQMEQGLTDLSLARGDEHRAAISVGYRPVDRGEEGQPGIQRPGQAEPSKYFAADFCLIVTAVLNGVPLTRRAALVQAKRLYPRDNDDPAQGWAPSFKLRSNQTRSLITQTASAFFVFQSPAELSRKLATMPAQLVDDLARNQTSSGAVISAEVVELASESFAEWFTYQFVALRTGDPLGELLEKVGDGPGRSPFDLVRYGVVDLEVRINDPKTEAG